MEKGFSLGYVLGKKKGLSHIVNLATKTVTENGIYNAADEGADGYSVFTVNTPVSIYGNLQVTENGNYNAVTAGYNGFSDVEVNVSDAVNLLANTGNAFLSLFNSKVTLAEESTNCANCFTGLKGFNQPVTVPDNVVDCSYMFHSCSNFNSLVNIGNNVNSCGYMFYECSNYNQPVFIPDNVIDGAGVLMSAKNFNSSVIIGNNVTNGKYMFYGCSNFNQPVIIPNSLVDSSYMFAYCNNFSQDIIIPEATKNCSSMLASCTNFSGNLYFRNSDGVNATKLFNQLTSSTKQKIIYCTNFEPFLGTASTNSLFGTQIDWAPVTNGYVCSYSCYLYNNMPDNI